MWWNILDTITLPIKQIQRCKDAATKQSQSNIYTVFHKIGTPLYFFNNILPCGPISIIDIPNCSAENRLAICDTFTYLTFIYSLKIVTSHPHQYLRLAALADKIDDVTDLVLSQDNAPNTHRTQRQIARQTGISLTSVNRVIKSNLRLKCL